ncbi:hypothetical protein E4K72_04560 [Oxalobacteraceae bacterium OM1]|nr:hypothetical protein E4K72_04560 [Oxalobacteraceae bacterium OM1]
MTRSAIIALLALLPLIGHADCGFTRSDGTVTLVVGKDSKCSSSFREAFRADLVASVQAMNGAEAVAQTQAAKRSFDDRTPRSQKLWALEERAFQSRMPSGRYFGQR